MEWILSLSRRLRPYRWRILLGLSLVTIALAAWVDQSEDVHRYLLKKTRGTRWERWVFQRSIRHSGDKVLCGLARGTIREGDDLESFLAQYRDDVTTIQAGDFTVIHSRQKGHWKIVAKHGVLVQASCTSCIHDITFFERLSADDKLRVLIEFLEAKKRQDKQRNTANTALLGALVHAYWNHPGDRIPLGSYYEARGALLGFANESPTSSIGHYGIDASAALLGFAEYTWYLEPEETRDARAALLGGSARLIVFGAND